MKKIRKLLFIFAILTAVLFSGIPASINFGQDLSQKIQYDNIEPEKLNTPALHWPTENFKIRNNNDEEISPQIEACIEAYIRAFSIMLYRFDTVKSREELAKIITERAIKSLLSVDKYGYAFTSLEAKNFTESRDSHLEGIGVGIYQGEEWTLESAKEVIMNEAQKTIFQDNELSVFATDPDGFPLNAFTDNVPIKSKLTTLTKITDKDIILETQYIRIRDYIKILDVKPNSGAQKAGLLAGDIILEVNGESTKEKTQQENVANIRGRKGTTVQLLIQRKGEKLPFEVTRGFINKSEFNIKTQIFGDIGYLKLTQFEPEDISKEFKKTVKDFSDKNVGKLVIDLRNNPGGFVHEVLETLGCFVEKGEILICTTIRDEVNKILRSDGPTFPAAGLFKGKIIILINNSSASASEVFSGVMKERGLAKIVGQKSFGKGCIQTPMSLNRNPAIELIKITTAEYKIYNCLKKDYIDVHGIGISPDLELTDPNIPIEEILKIPGIMEYLK